MSEQDAAPSSTEPQGDLPNDQAASESTPSLSTGDAVSATTESPTSTSTDSQGSTASGTGETTDTTSVGDDPNGDVLPVVSGIVGVTASSAEPASSPVDTAAVSGSVGDIANGIRARIAAIKAHMIDFEEAVKEKIHAELDAIEGWL